MTQSTKTALSVAVLVIVAGAFWLLLISPKRDKADELSKQVASARTELASAQQQVKSSLVAKKRFPRSYQQMILLGKAVPVDSGTASMMVQLNELGNHSRTPFLGIELKEGVTAEAPLEGVEAESVDSLPPLGSGLGPAGLGAMPYELTFEGGFFAAADFIASVDSLVQTNHGRLYVNGRLMTFDNFEMTLPSSAVGSFGYRELSLKFHVTAYTTPVGQGLTAGASSAGPAIE